MLFVQLFLIISSSVYTVLLFLLAFSGGRIFKLLSINALSGLILLGLLAILKKILGLNVFFNIYTILMSIIWGIPGVIIQILSNTLLF